ncbi:MAG TPA: hypothetical protein VLW65_03930 [Bryobacteraceae bacterium]|nr:hypothetical protein [Bryobacteraceae bacterium]
MTKKSLLFAGALALSTISIASAKSYEILLPKTIQAGQMQLAAGQYRVKLEGANAIFTNVETNHSFVAPVNVENTQKHEVTAVEVTNQGGSSHLTSIELGGSSETLQFGE